MKKSTAQEIRERGTWLRITAPHAVAAVIVFEGKVRMAAPIFGYAIGWTKTYLYEHCAGRSWKLEKIRQGEVEGEGEKATGELEEKVNF